MDGQPLTYEPDAAETASANGAGGEEPPETPPPTGGASEPEEEPEGGEDVHTEAGGIPVVIQDDNQGVVIGDGLSVTNTFTFEDTGAEEPVSFTTTIEDDGSSEEEYPADTSSNNEPPTLFVDDEMAALTTSGSDSDSPAGEAVAAVFRDAFQKVLNTREELVAPTETSTPETQTDTSTADPATQLLKEAGIDITRNDLSLLPPPVGTDEPLLITQVSDQPGVAPEDMPQTTVRIPTHLLAAALQNHEAGGYVNPAVLEYAQALRRNGQL